MISPRVLMILVLMGLVVVAELDKVYGLTSADIALRWKGEDRLRRLMENQQNLKPAADMKKSLKNTKKIRPSSSSSSASKNSCQEFESSKRKVRKGSDPIHNRS